MTEEELRATFTLAGIQIQRLWKLPNGYVADLEPLTDEQIEMDKPGQAGVVEVRPTYSFGVVRDWMNDYRWRFNRPAWLIKTEWGLIQITPRKRVTDIEWSDTPVRAIVTEDSTTCDPTRVHAWTDAKIIEYLRAWKALAIV